ncbi:hypothetical protein ACFE04_024781 [Oxalis oulophora]
MDSYSDDDNSTHRAPQQPHHQRQKPSSSELLSSAKYMAEAAKATLSHDSGKIDKSRMAAAAEDLLGAASYYGKFEETSYGKYVNKAEDYLHKYQSKQQSSTVSGHQSGGQQYSTEQSNYSTHQSGGNQYSTEQASYSSHQSGNNQYEQANYSSHQSGGQQYPTGQGNYSTHQSGGQQYPTEQANYSSHQSGGQGNYSSHQSGGQQYPTGQGNYSTHQSGGQQYPTEQGNYSTHQSGGQQYPTEQGNYYSHQSGGNQYPTGQGNHSTASQGHHHSDSQSGEGSEGKFSEYGDYFKLAQGFLKKSRCTADHVFGAAIREDVEAEFVVEIFSSKEEETEDGEKKISKGNQAKELLAKYGGAYLATSITLSLISFALCYALISVDVDVQSLLQKKLLYKLLLKKFVGKILDRSKSDDDDNDYDYDNMTISGLLKSTRKGGIIKQRTNLDDSPCQILQSPSVDCEVSGTKTLSQTQIIPPSAAGDSEAAKITKLETGLLDTVMPAQLTVGGSNAEIRD